MKTQKPIHIKNPKKVAAGKARAATAIKDKQGKYIGKFLYNEVARIALAIKGNDVTKVNADNTKEIAALMRNSGVSTKEVKELYENNPIAFEDIIERGNITGTSKNSNQTEKSIDNFKGDFYLNGMHVNKTKMKKALLDFKQFLSVNLNVVDFTLRPVLSYAGELHYNIPDIRKLIKGVMNYFEVDNVDELSQFDVAEMTDAIADVLSEMGFENIVIYSSDKKKRKTKERARRIEIVHKQISKTDKKVLCGTTGMITRTTNPKLVTCQKCLDKMYTVK